VDHSQFGCVSATVVPHPKLAGVVAEHDAVHVGVVPQEWRAKPVEPPVGGRAHGEGARVDIAVLHVEQRATVGFEDGSR
jgi:hypothetical protein